MSKFKWNNKINERNFWDADLDGGRGGEITSLLTDKQIVNNPSGARFEDILRAACNVLSELIEIEENRPEPYMPSEPEETHDEYCLEPEPIINTYEFRGITINEEVPKIDPEISPDIAHRLERHYEEQGFKVDKMILDANGKIGISVSKKLGGRFNE